MIDAKDLLANSRQKYSTFKHFNTEGFINHKLTSGQNQTLTKIHFQFSFSRTIPYLIEFRVKSFEFCSFQDTELLVHLNCNGDKEISNDLSEEHRQSISSHSETCLNILKSLLVPNEIKERNIFDASHASIMAEELLDVEQCTKMVLRPNISPKDELIWVGCESYFVRKIESEFSMNKHKLFKGLPKEQRPSIKEGEGLLHSSLQISFLKISANNDSH